MFGIFVFSEGEVLFCDVFLLVSFSSFCFFERCICYWNKSYFGLAFGFGIIYFFLEGEVLFCDVFLLVSFSFFCFFFFERRVCYWNNSCFGLAFWVWNCLFFFGRRGVVLRRVFVAFVFLLLFFLGGVEDVFVIGISRVSVWPFGFGII